MKSVKGSSPLFRQFADRDGAEIINNGSELPEAIKQQMQEDGTALLGEVFGGMTPEQQVEYWLEVLALDPDYLMKSYVYCFACFMTLPQELAIALLRATIKQREQIAETANKTNRILTQEETVSIENQWLRAISMVIPTCKSTTRLLNSRA